MMDLESLKTPSRGGEKDPNLLVHLQLDECRAFDLLQGGTQVIPVDDNFSRRMHALGVPVKNGQIRDYRPLKNIINDPEVQNLFYEVIQKEDKGQDKELLDHYYKIGKKASQNIKDVPENDPELKALAKMGEGKDTEIAYMPLSVCNFLDEIRGSPPQTNFKTGFPEYGLGNFFKSVVRTALTIIGAVMGGPIGAVGGNMAGRMATGQKPGSAFQASLPNALYTMGAQGVGGALGNVLPGTSVGSLGTSLSNLGGNLSTSGLLNSATGALTGGGVSGSVLGGGGLDLLKTAAPYAIGGMSINALKKGRKEEMKAWEKENEKAREEREHLRRRLGLYDGLESLQPDVNPSIDQEYYKELSSKSFKKGGQTSALKKDLNNYVSVSESYKGKSKGQADTLKKNVPINGYIASADAVSMVGDGNTNAGLSSFQKLEKRVLAKYKGKRVNRKLSKLKANTSDGEYQFSPLFVTILGRGNNNKGSRKLDKGIAKLRLHKTCNGPHLSPKALPFEEYLR